MMELDSLQFLQVTLLVDTHTPQHHAAIRGEVSVIKMHTILFLLSLPEALGSVVGAGGS